jgi:hypothetical protein
MAIDIGILNALRSRLVDLGTGGHSWEKRLTGTEPTS